MNFIRNIGLTELIVIIVVLLMIFGRKKINQVARDAGKATKEYKKIKKEYSGAVETVVKDFTPKTQVVVETKENKSEKIKPKEKTEEKNKEEESEKINSN